jgi:hypothetical protein
MRRSFQRSASAVALYAACQGSRTRLAPIHDPPGTCVPTIYAAETLEAAVFETVFHDVPANASLKVVALTKVLSRSLTRSSKWRTLCDWRSCLRRT